MCGMTQMAKLDRVVLRVGGADRVGFLQGLVSNDVTAVAPGRAVFAALLTPQGKYLADFFMLAAPDEPALLLDCAPGQAGTVAARLTRFRLRADVQISVADPPWHVYAAWPDAPPAPPDGLLVADPRLAAAGWRVVTRGTISAAEDAAAYDRHRLALGLPDGALDLEAERSLLLEAGFDALHGISWTKGCYMGQELTARTRYRGLVKRSVVRVLVAGALPPPGTPIMAEGREVGVLHHGRDDVAMATLRLDALTADLSAGDVALRVAPPDWAGASETMTPA